MIPSSRDSSEELVASILMTMRDEANRLNGVFLIEEQKRGNISEDIRASVKFNGKTFRITMSYVREDAIETGQLPSGWAYIETDWELRIRHSQDEHGSFHSHWYREYRPSERGTSRPPAQSSELVDAEWLRLLIRQKLAA